MERTPAPPYALSTFVIIIIIIINPPLPGSEYENAQKKKKEKGMESCLLHKLK